MRKSEKPHPCGRGFPIDGGVAEWLMAAVFKTAPVHAGVGPNPTPSTISLYSCRDAWLSRPS